MKNKENTRKKPDHVRIQAIVSAVAVAAVLVLTFVAGAAASSGGAL